MHDTHSSFNRNIAATTKTTLKRSHVSCFHLFLFISLGIAVCYQWIGIWILKLNGKAKISKYDTYSLVYPIYIKKYIYKL